MIALLGGTICDPAAGYDGPADLYLAGGRVLAVSEPGAPPPPGAFTAIDADGLVIVPGPVDTLCRCDLTSGPWREDVATLAAAAAAGGYTAILAYTGLSDPQAVAALTQADLPVRVLPVAALSAGGRLLDLGLLADAGAVAFSDWPRPGPDAVVLRRALEYAGHLKRTVVITAQDEALAAGGVAHEGVRAFALGLAGIPAAAEIAAVAAAATVQEAFGGRLHFAALSSAGSLGRIGAATAAITAHHLLLDETQGTAYDTAAKLAPPLRTPADRAALVEAVRSGRCLLASGHWPCPPEEKAQPYDYASFGASAIETALPAAFALLGPMAFVQACATGPAAAFGLDAGSLAPGAVADVTVLAPNAPWTVAPERLVSRGRATPLAGRVLQARVVLTISRGRIAFDGRATMASAG